MNSSDNSEKPKNRFSILSAVKLPPASSVSDANALKPLSSLSRPPLASVNIQKNVSAAGTQPADSIKDEAHVETSPRIQTPLNEAKAALASDNQEPKQTKRKPPKFDLSGIGLKRHDPMPVFHTLLAFNFEHIQLAKKVCDIVGCSLEDLIKRISVEIDTDNIDLTARSSAARAEGKYRYTVRIQQSIVDKVRADRDPLNIRTDGYLLRAPILNAFDEVTEQFLDQMKVNYGIQ